MKIKLISSQEDQVCFEAWWVDRDVEEGRKIKISCWNLNTLYKDKFLQEEQGLF